MAQIRLYVTTWCPYCSLARNLLKSLGVKWEEIDIQREGISRAQLADLTGRFTVPQIMINDQPIGGYTELYELQQSGRLEMLLQGSPPP
ncbi:MAG: glutathione S-transferase N-terminal domain-containing protein [Fidelibacterota bacterium]|nr:MAG: glutathione S-transferase N-terminal domain-containing protein [Candidatus Neomarinimicrobiota bacterium]